MKSRHLYFRKDKGHRVLASFKPSAGLASSRVQALRQQITSLRLASLGNAALPLLSLVLWDAVIAVTDLRPAWVALNAPRRWRGKAFITWRAENETHQRRFLAPFTLIAAMQHRTLPPFEVAEEAIRDVFAARGLCSHSAVPSAVLHSLLDDTAAWAFAWLPPYLAMHVTAERRLACLPDSCLAREASDGPIVVARGEMQEPDGGLIDKLFNATEICPSDEFCESLNAALVAPTELSDLRLRKLILLRLRELFSIESSWSLSEALIGAWTYHLVEVGTRDTSPLDPRTAIEYVRLILNHLFKLLSPVLDAGVEDVAAWRKLHTDILQAVDEGSRHKARAALTAFQAFAAEHIGAPHPQALSRPQQAVEKAPRANVVWPAEIAWVREQLAQLPDSRFQLQVRVVFELLLFTGARVES